MKNLIPSKSDVNGYFQGHWSDFYSRFLPDIKKAGAGKFVALCPFHSDGNPSLSINDDSGLFHCFGCEKSGDAFTFFGLVRSISSFPEILKGIGDEFKMPVSDRRALSMSGGKSSNTIKQIDEGQAGQGIGQEDMHAKAAKKGASDMGKGRSCEPGSPLS